MDNKELENIKTKDITALEVKEVPEFESYLDAYGKAVSSKTYSFTGGIHCSVCGILKDNDVSTHANNHGDDWTRSLFVVKPMGMVVKGKITEKHIELFAKTFNYAAQLGWIKGGILVKCIKLSMAVPSSEILPEKWLILSYPFGEIDYLSIDYMNTMLGTKVFTELGELPSDSWCALEGLFGGSLD